MTRTKSYPLTFEILAVAILCLISIAGRSQEDTLNSATQTDPAYGNCHAPTQSGLNVCNAESLASPFQVIAAATGGRGEVRVVQLWADGSKLAEVGSNVFNQTVQLPFGKHALTLVELDSTGYYLKTDPIPVEIRYMNNGNCDPPLAPGVHVCEPSGCNLQGYTTVVAAGTGANGPVVRMELWVGNTKYANFPGNRINTNLNLPDYSYGTIIEVDSKGGFIKSAPFLIVSC